MRPCAWLAMVAAAVGELAAAPARAEVALAREGKALATIVLCDQPIPAERTAARELAEYLGKATGATFAVVGEADKPKDAPAIHLGPTAFARSHGLDTAGWDAERWAMRTVGRDLVLTGGRPRGTLYAVYHFLEDAVGVRWWNPFEEHVPRKPALAAAELDRTGQPRFNYRDIHLLYAHDDGRFAARHRINARGFGALSSDYGCGPYYGPPNGVHTFYMYIPPDTYFADHPDWFSMIKGKRTRERGQLCLTNAALRAEVVKRLREFIAAGQAAADKAGRPAPVDFDISQNDWYGQCECPACSELARREGSQAGPLLDFLNHVADAVAKDYPQVRINTLAYQYTEDPPATIRPRDSVMPRLCDTNANLLQPITHADNRPFAERLARWGKVAKNLRIWDYAVTYTAYPGLPLPTAHTYAPDYRYFAAHNVQGVFTEHEHSILADMRDYKIYLMMKLLEDPDRSDADLTRDFCDGFYGPAGPHVRRYLDDLRQAADKSGSNVDWFPALSKYRYLTLDFVRSAQATFDQAERALAGDDVRLRRLRHARLPLDRACLVFWPGLMREWTAGGGKPEQVPLDRDAIGRRARQAWHEQVDLRFPAGQRPGEKAKADQELDPLLARKAFVPLPEKFRHLPPGRVFDFTADQSNNWKDQARRVPDEQAESGVANRLELTDADMAKYKLPMPWGAYDTAAKRGLASASIKGEDVSGPGYHWYKLPPATLTASSYVYFFWSWIIQVPVESAVDAKAPSPRCEVWARIKFEGPGFPHGQGGPKNAIYIERVVVVRLDQDGPAR